MSVEYKASQLLNTGRLCKLRSPSWAQAEKPPSLCVRCHSSRAHATGAVSQAQAATWGSSPATTQRHHTDPPTTCVSAQATQTGVVWHMSKPHRPADLSGFGQHRKTKFTHPKYRSPTVGSMSDILKQNSRLVSTQKKKEITHLRHRLLLVEFAKCSRFHV